MSNCLKPLLALLVFFTSFTAVAEDFRRISVEAYRDKMKAAWVGQIAGVAWGAPTEFKYNGRIIPEAEMPKWWPEMINNAFGQDDLYVEMTFLRTLEEHGFDVTQTQAGIDFANSRYMLWHANNEGRNNLRRGIAPPDSGHPAFNRCADDIDYQIEADYSGIIAPGMPQMVIELGDKFGGLMNYGDGLYAGQFVGGMYAEAFFETDMIKIIQAGLACIPPDSQYAGMVRDLLEWYAQEPDNWEATWAKINEKYHKNPDCRKFCCSAGDFNIDAKINGAYILMGMLYGKGDLDRTIIISTRCGQDSDCNPSNAAGVLFATLGFSKLPPRFCEKLNEQTKFSYTEYNFPALVDVCEKLARQAVVRAGGKVETNEAGEEFFVIPVRKPVVGAYKPSWRPDPPKNVKFTEEEMQQIMFRKLSVTDTLEKFFAGWAVDRLGPDMEPGHRDTFRGRKNVLMTHPLDRDTACVLTREITVPEGKTTSLRATVSHHDGGDWELGVRCDGEQLEKRLIGKDTVGEDGWLTVEIDLTPFAGKTVKLELENAANGWSWEAGYWAAIEIESK